MRQRVKNDFRAKQTAIGRSIPAPILGWDASNPLAAMDPKAAVILDNMIPRPAYVEYRRGYVPQVTGTPAAVEALLTYRGSASGDKLFACAGANIYDVSTQNAPLPAPGYALATSARWIGINFANPAGANLWAANGVDTPIYYNGAAWAALTITGTSGPLTLDPKTLSVPMVHKGRIYAIEKNTLRVWYLAAAAIQGATGLLDMSSIFSKGGHLVCASTWTGYYGLAADNFAVFMTSEGQVALYQGTDPTSGTTWALVGVYDLGKPLGPKALVRFGADLIILTTDGVVPFSKALQIDRAQEDTVSLTAMIKNAFADAQRLYRSNFGWEGLIYPEGQLAIFNIPVTSLGTSYQYVQNTQTGAWARFTGINAFCWETANNKVYFGTTDGIYQWDSGSSDNATAIIANVKPAFNDFGARGQLKQFTMLRPLLNTTSLIDPALEMNVDYKDSTPTAQPTVVDSGSTAQGIRYDWTSVTGLGYVGAPHMQISLLGDVSVDELSVDGTDLITTGDGFEIAIAAGTPFDVPCWLIGFDVMFRPGGQL